MIAARAAKPSRGMTVVAVLVCLIILTLISGAVLKVSVAQRELARGQERRLQAEWLAESGAQRAIARLAARSRLRRRDVVAQPPRPGPERAAPPASSAPPRPIKPAARITIAVERVPAAAESTARAHPG